MRSVPVAARGLCALLLGLLCVVGLALPASAGGTRVVSLADFGARCDGRHDDRAALVAALADLRGHGGGTLLIPAGDCRVVETAADPVIDLTGPVTIRGASPAATISADTDAPGDPAAFRTLFQVRGHDVNLQGLQLRRASNAFVLFMDVYGVAGLHLDRVRLDGRQDAIRGVDVDGVEISGTAADRTSDVRITNSTFTGLDYGFFQADPTPVFTRGIVVDHSTFLHNYADDLEFNAPSGGMTGISVTNSTFSDNRYSDPAAYAGIGVGMAHVNSVRVEHNTFAGYRLDPVHIENHTGNVLVRDNHFSDSFTLPTSYSSMVFVVSGAHDISVEDNTFDTTANENDIYCVYAGTGGAPDEVRRLLVTGNRFILRPNAKPVGLFGAERVVVVNNATTRIP